MAEAKRAARRGALLAIACAPTLAVIAACSSNSNPPADLGSTGGGQDSSVVVDTGSPKPPSDAGKDSTPTQDADAMGDGTIPMDGTASDTGTPQPEGGDFDASVYGDVVIGPPDDGGATDAGPTGDSSKGNGNVCVQELGWWAVGATLDSSVSPNAAALLNPLLSVQNPITLADYFSDAGETDAGPQLILISGTETNGVSQQYFPFTYPTAPATLAQTAGSAPVFTATSPAGQPSAGWIRLLDSTQAEVWIALTDINATLTAGDPQCQSLSSGVITAVIPTSAGATTMVLSSGSTSVAAVFGATTSTSPPGWNIRLTFTGEKVEVTFK
jgi:hypothetical protein